MASREDADSILGTSAQEPKRLRAELVAGGSPYVGQGVFGGWSRRPAERGGA